MVMSSNTMKADVERSCDDGSKKGGLKSRHLTQLAAIAISFLLGRITSGVTVMTRSCNVRQAVREEPVDRAHGDGATSNANETTYAQANKLAFDDGATSKAKETTYFAQANKLAFDRISNDAHFSARNQSGAELFNLAKWKAGTGGLTDKDRIKLASIYGKPLLSLSMDSVNPQRLQMQLECLDTLALIPMPIGWPWQQKACRTTIAFIWPTLAPPECGDFQLSRISSRTSINTKWLLSWPSQTLLMSTWWTVVIAFHVCWPAFCMPPHEEQREATLLYCFMIAWRPKQVTERVNQNAGSIVLQTNCFTWITLVAGFASLSGVRIQPTRCYSTFGRRTCLTFRSKETRQHVAYFVLELRYT
jgi:hypothetical protein